MEIKDRLIKIISSEGLTSAAFADSIGVQRSSISHIVSGRNNPSLDFLQKILISYPKYNAEWLLMGLGELYKHPTQTELFNKPVSLLNTTINQSKIVADASLSTNKPSVEPSLLEEKWQNNIFKEENKPIYNATKNTITDRIESKEKQIHKIVFFYTDKTLGVLSES